MGWPHAPAPLSNVMPPCYLSESHSNSSRRQEVDSRLAANVPPALLARLYPFQRQGVEFMVRVGGRALLAVGAEGLFTPGDLRA